MNIFLLIAIITGSAIGLLFLALIATAITLAVKSIRRIAELESHKIA